MNASAGKKMILFAAAVLLLLWPVITCAAISGQAAETAALEEHTEHITGEGAEDLTLHCKEGSAACVMLQMAAHDQFTPPDPDDLLSLRVESTSLQRLKMITPEDILHYSREFDADNDRITKAWYSALANCLWADILYRSSCSLPVSNSMRVLLLFLDPASEEEADEQIRQIRERTDEETCRLIADDAEVPADFVNWLMTRTDDDRSSAAPDREP